MDEAIKDLQARVARLEDIEAVHKTWRDYIFALDSSDWDSLRDVFAEDGAVEMVGLADYRPGQDRTYRGRDEILNDFYIADIEEIANPSVGAFYTGHHGTNMEIDFEEGGDEATTLAYFFEILGKDQVLIGTYQHRMRREADRWRIVYLRIAIRYRCKIEGTDFGGLSLAEVRGMAAV